ncbi:NfeD family protein [Dysgonomonas sp. Marseille-Q5470]|uniref:NfeD family protein n=1 Tax=Dysgonomonas sp. Marseille-Q5470 TaxID=3039494 RepID=UPI0024BD17E8|nr:NfeD family protein [Dysgonomonas sp. Marseille-Q5470]
MKEFFANMDGTQQFYWYIAIGASVIFIIQTIMTFVGADADTGVDADFDGNLDGGDSPFQLFSLRNLINFLLGFGWAGVSLYNVIESNVLLAIVAFLVGVLFIAFFFFIMRALLKLSEDNSFKIEDTIGKTADVYLSIPAAKKGKGKVFISVRGSTHELSAITNSVDEIKNGSLVKVVGIEGDILIVTPLTL